MMNAKTKFYVADDECAQKVIVNKSKGSIKVKADLGYTPDWYGKTLTKLHDDGNGVVVWFTDSAEPIYLDYSELDYLRTTLNTWQDYFYNGN